ncbi:hypothetical protein LZ31DRAFT_451947, partial [Colletotrichum somersetense]
APNDSTTLTSVREEYLAVLARANTNINPASWHADWQKCYLRGKQYGIPEVQGNLATKSFLRAVSNRLAPTWGKEALNRVVENETTNKENLSLSDYGAIFIALHHEETLMKGKGKVSGVYATLSDRSDGNFESHSPKMRECPCGVPATCHPADCPQVEMAVRGVSRQTNLKQTQEESTKIREKLKEDRWRSVRYALINKGWMEQPNKAWNKKRFPPKKSKTKDGNDSGSASGTGNSVVCVSIDPALIEKELQAEAVSHKVFTYSYNGPHALSKCTVFDNCGATHLVNDLSLLEPDSLEDPKSDECVESGSSSFPVIKKGKRVLKKILSGPNGPNTVDLVLTNVCYVENFHVNVVSEARLRRADVWYCGHDCTLRRGPVEKSEVVSRLVRKFNLVFLQYNVRSA